mmetsp:Transcript_26969/g.41343  ORF Transcript_26969/g.41343 Transcript_26969/m.41343 type:complete len:183 (+) Transcript_26969:47-595(+)
MPAVPPKKRSSITGYHVFFSEQRSKLIEEEGPDSALTKKDVRMIASQWRSLDTVSRCQYEWRSQHETCRTQSTVDCKKTDPSFNKKKIIKKKTRNSKRCIRKQKNGKYSKWSGKDSQHELVERPRVGANNAFSTTKIFLNENGRHGLSNDQLQQQLSIAVAIKELQTYKDDYLVAFMCETFL